MFAVITFEKEKKFFGKAIRIKKIQGDNFRFYQMTLKHKKNINWPKVKKHLGEAKNRIVISNEIKSTELEKMYQLGLNLVDESSYANMLTQKALREILNVHKESLIAKTAVLIDLACKFQSYADILIEHFGIVKIFTGKPFLYQNYKEAKLYELGATVIISDSFDKIAEKATLIVSPICIIFPSMIDIKIPIITANNPRHFERMNIFHSFEAEATKEICDVIEPDISAHSFQSALYEHCGMRGLANNKIILCKKNCENVSFEEAKINIFTIDIQ